MRLIIVLLLLILPIEAHATAVFDFLSTATITFNVPWISTATEISRTVATSGVHELREVIDFNESADRRQYSQFVGVAGSVGASEFTEENSGKILIIIRRFVYFTFDFGPTPTSFVMLLNYSGTYSSHHDLPWIGPVPGGSGERIGGGGGVQVQFDGTDGPWYEKKDVTFANVTGVHTVRVMDSANNVTDAVYPLVLPEPSGASLLFCGLIVLVGFKNIYK